MVVEVEVCWVVESFGVCVEFLFVFVGFCVDCSDLFERCVDEESVVDFEWC